jgi:hypothetical protein
MTERTRTGVGPTESGLHFQISKLLVSTSIGAIAATGALIIAVVTELPGPPPPPGPNGLPPPPPDLRSLVVVTILTGLFVLAWLGVIVAFSRDQILLRIREDRYGPSDPDAGQHEIRDLFAGLRQELAEDRQAELAMLEERITSLTSEYGEQRETDGYINGMRLATTPPQQATAEVRSIRRAPPR